MSDSSAGSGLYKIKTISEQTGFTPTLLRAWERRYALLKPDRKPSGHRLYTEEDRRVLVAVRALLREGRSIGEIAAEGRSRLLQRENASAQTESLPDVSPVIESLRDRIVASAMRLDAAGLQGLLDESFATLERENVFLEVMVPCIRRLGRLWVDGQATVAHEHLASALFCRRLLHWLGVVNRKAQAGPTVVAGCLPDEQHEFGALLVTYYLASAGAQVTFLGSLPLGDLELACRELKPALAMLSVTRSSLFDIHRPRLAELVERSKQVRFVLGGPGLREREHQVTLLGADFWPPERPLGELQDLLAAV